MPAEENTEPAIHPIISGLKDFSEKMSPVLVKELRQGMRAHSFSILFLVVQVILALIVFGVAISPASDSSGESISRFMIGLYAITVMIVQPMRGMTALHQEIKGNTIDLLVLTRLSAWRITLGKWCSLFAQNLLMLITLVPYIIMRYFFGGMQLFSELMILFSITIIGGALVAFTIGLSANSNIIVRSLLPIAGAFFGTFAIIGITASSNLDDLGRLHTFSADYSFLLYLASMALIIYLGYYFLEIGTQAIAPHAENRSTLKRLITLLVLLAGLIPISFADGDSTLILGCFFISLIGLDVLTESGYFPSSVCRPFAKRGKLGRLAGRLLYPGWYTGILFFTLTYLCVAAVIKFSMERRYASYSGGGLTSLYFEEILESLGIFFAVVGQLLFAALILRLFFKKKGNHFGLFIVIQLICAILFAFMAMYAESTKNFDIMVTFFFSPFFLIPVFLDHESSRDMTTFVTTTAVICLLYSAIITLLSIKYFTHLNKLEDDTLADEI